MKTRYISLFVFILFLFALGSISAQKVSKNAYLFAYFVGNGEDGLHLAYSYDGQVWKALKDGKSFLTPTVGKDRLMRDPSIVQGSDGVFRMVWTSGWWDRGIGYASSKDLVHWSDQQNIPVMEYEPTAKNAWAPELFYDKKSKNYYIFWASTVPSLHPNAPDSATEKGLNHRLYSVTTSNFRSFSKTTLFFDPDFSVIDGTILKRGDEYMLFLKNETLRPVQKNIRVSVTENLQKGFPTEVSSPITGNYWAEGPSPLLVDGYIYVYFDKYRDHKYGAVRSKDGKNWEDVSDKVSFPKGMRHGTAFQVSSAVLDSLLLVR
ncbi:MAG: family 43 glycosylhydrolase [Paludibacter sp.]|nr:glycoside hydrolase family 43 protein [Paludibacter sp.]MTK52352.1 family 43 glycosylhydrolase [Paludibacter sp.]